MFHVLFQHLLVAAGQFDSEPSHPLPSQPFTYHNQESVQLVEEVKSNNANVEIITTFNKFLKKTYMNVQK